MQCCWCFSMGLICNVCVGVRACFGVYWCGGGDCLILFFTCYFSQISFSRMCVCYNFFPSFLFRYRVNIEIFIREKWDDNGKAYTIEQKNYAIRAQVWPTHLPSDSVLSIATMGDSMLTGWPCVVCVLKSTNYSKNSGIAAVRVWVYDRVRVCVISARHETMLSTWNPRRFIRDIIWLYQTTFALFDVT